MLANRPRGRPKDESGQRFGKLVAEAALPRKYNEVYQWKCRCDCGGERIARGSDLRSGKINSCGCDYVAATGSGSGRWSGYAQISGTTWGGIVRNAKSRGTELSLSKAQAWNLFLSQNRRCALSGVTLTFASSAKRRVKDQTASLDRIDSSKGYVIGNVQWIHKRLQPVKSDLAQEELVGWCQLIVDNFKNKEGHNIMTPALVMSVILALLTDFPTLIADVEKLIAQLKGQPTNSVPDVPVAPVVAAETQAADAALNTPIV